MEKLPVKDTLNLKDDKGLVKALGSETVIWSGELTKINKRKKSQVRRFLLTSKRFINLGDEKLFDSIMSFFSGNSFKRAIDLSEISYITYSEVSNEFILHVPKEYDYRLRSHNCRDEFIYYLVKLREGVVNTPMKFWLKMEIELAKWTKTEDMKQSCFPPGDPVIMTSEQFKNYYNERNLKKIEESKNTVTLISSDGKQLTENDFEIIRVLGRGAFGKVILTQKKDDGELYAVKIMNKGDVIEKNQIEQIKTEKDILEKVRHPFLVGLEYCFHSPSRIYFVMKFMQGGELFQHLKKAKRFSEPDTKFYAAQILLALEYLHKMDIIYRDLKPENVLLDSNGYLKLADFGVSKKLTNPAAKTNTIVGTPEYVPPEIITQKGHGKEADWWSFGIFIFEMLVGLPPFYNKNQHTMLCQIIKDPLKFPSSLKISNEAKDLLNKLLEKSPDKRLGHEGDATAIKQHPWFADLDFDALCDFKLKAPIVPELNDKFDVAYFDTNFTKEDPRNTRRESTELLLIDNFNHEFNDFDYRREDQPKAE